ncbi:uncharacterized protein LOC128883709 [Hylaeus volcanicus]|uniref:uncharacterized protein LOC128883709 n=1 Tax=Hylaeus volcanicus TaxID=313075 RepID=UPI0023B7AEF5|nr:uncharacterized protein LOC128883709 [Hylaeus volcanicus]
MSRVLSTPTDSCKVFRGKVSIALIIRTYIEKCGFSIINQWKAFSLEELWRFCILPCICNASFTVANHTTFSAHLLISHFKTKFPEWFLIPQVLALLLFRFCRQGDPCLRSSIHCLSIEYQKNSISDSVWPIVNLFVKIFDKVNLPKEWISTWIDISDTTTYLEHMIDNEDFDINDDCSLTLPNDESVEFSQLQKNTAVNATFSKKFSTIKTTATFPILNLWLLEMDQRQEIFNFINLVWDIFVSCSWVASPLDYAPFQFLERLDYNTPLARLLEGVSERLKPFLSPSYIFMDGLFSFIELLAHKEKLNVNSTNHREKESWKDAAINFFTKVFSYNFKNSEMMFFLEIRRLTFIEAIPSLLCTTHMDATLILQFIFEKIFLTDVSIKTSSVERFAFNKDIEEFDLDSAYFIRRRALYALISYCRTSSENIKTLLEPIMERVKQRLASDSIQQVERSLLIQSMISIAAASKNYNVQKWFGYEIIENFKQTLSSLHLSEITQNINTFVVFFFGQSSTWTGNKNELTELISKRRKVIRFITQVEAILQYATIPVKLQELKNGGYVVEEYMEALPLQSADPNEACTKCLSSQNDFSQDMDFSQIFKFGLRHPMSDFVLAMLPSLLKILSVYNNTWADASLSQTFQHLNFLLTVGEEEWKSLAGDAPTSGTIRGYVENTFPLNYSTVSVDDVRTVRRQNFHLRILLYRCLGRMSQVYTAFFSYPCIQKELRHFILHETNMAPTLHLSNSLEYFWQSFFSEENILSLQMYSTVSIFNLLHHIFLPLLAMFQNRIGFELEKISQEQKACTEKQNTCSDFLIRGYSLIRVENLLLDIITELVNLKGFVFNKKEKTNSSYAIMENTNEPKTTSNFCLSYNDLESHVESTETSHSNPLIQLKQFLHYDATFVQGIVSFCLQLAQFPNATIMKDAYLTLRLMIKQLTKYLQPIPSTTIQILSLIYQKLLESILVAPTLEDISSFSTMDTKYKERCSPYSKFLFDKNYQGGLPTVAGTVLYECLMGFLRCTQNTSTHSPITVIEELPKFPELYNAILQLSTLPYPMSSTDLETLTRELLLPKEKQDLRVTKSALVTFVAKNLNTFNNK